MRGTNGAGQLSGLIDYFSLALTHALLVIALLRLIKRNDVDREEPSSGDDMPNADADDTPHPDTIAGKRAAMRKRMNGGSSDA